MHCTIIILASLGLALFMHIRTFLMHLTESNALDLNAPNERMQKYTEMLMEERERYGVNPDVFCYQEAKGNESVNLIMYLRIYEGSKVTLMFKNGLTRRMSRASRASHDLSLLLDEPGRLARRL